MKTCAHCGALNNDGDRYCDWCGSMLPSVKEEPVRDGREHDFTTGVMRYAPDPHDPKDKELPVYLTRQAAGVLQQSQEGTQGAVPAASPAPATSAIPQDHTKKRKETPQAKSRTGRVTVIMIGVIAMLILLIIIGVVLVLGGMV